MNINEKKDQNYYKLVEDILDNEEFQSLKNVAHHGLNRYDHCLRVSYYSYKITKLLSLSPDEVARAALLHDFFLKTKILTVIAKNDSMYYIAIHSLH